MSDMEYLTDARKVITHDGTAVLVLPWELRDTLAGIIEALARILSDTDLPDVIESQETAGAMESGKYLLRQLRGEER